MSALRPTDRRGEGPVQLVPSPVYEPEEVTPLPRPLTPLVGREYAAATPTDTPTETPKETPTATATATVTETPSPTPCTGKPVAVLVPQGGVVSGTILIDASGSSDPCGRALEFSWDCAPPDLKCDAFLARVNSDPAHVASSGTFPLVENEQYSFLVTVCPLGLGNSVACSQAVTDITGGLPS